MWLTAKQSGKQKEKPPMIISANVLQGVIVSYSLAAQQRNHENHFAITQVY